MLVIIRASFVDLGWTKMRSYIILTLGRLDGIDQPPNHSVPSRLLDVRCCSLPFLSVVFDADS